MKKLVFTLICLFPIFTSQAIIITVDDNGPADFDNIQDAINVSGPGDTVIVKPGTYNGRIFFNNKPATVTSENPDDPDVVWVAAMGHLYSQNPERGIYKTTDGGKTWKRTLFVNDKTGAIDLVINPQDPNILYAAMWERQAWRWDRHESGAGSGIYKSEDGGETWQLISREDNGFPTGKYVGRIG